jgi:hypothetical protein
MKNNEEQEMTTEKNVDRGNLFQPICGVRPNPLFKHKTEQNKVKITKVRTVFMLVALFL